MAISRPQREEIAALINSIEVSYIMIENADNFETRKRWVNARREARVGLWKQFGIDTLTDYDREMMAA